MTEEGEREYVGVWVWDPLCDEFHLHAKPLRRLGQVGVSRKQVGVCYKTYSQVKCIQRPQRREKRSDPIARHDEVCLFD